MGRQQRRGGPDRALAHPFVCRLGDGSLDREIFARYVAQDAFVLESFVRAYALALAHRPDTPTLLALADLLAGRPGACVFDAAPTLRLSTTGCRGRQDELLVDVPKQTGQRRMTAFCMPP